MTIIDEVLDESLVGTNSMEAFYISGPSDVLKNVIAEPVLIAEVDVLLEQEGEQAFGSHR
jgi:hypothetical protein